MTDTTPATDATEQPTGPRILVGVDGSDPSLDALRQAARFAPLLGASIEAVTTWTYPVMTGPFAMAEAPSFEDFAKETLEQALKDAYGDDRPENLLAEVRFGHPAQVLIDLSEGAEMLVLGSRGRGGFAGLLLGSVSSECASHAKCPVLIVR
ncbi:universal stress protein [Humibacter soli]